MQFLAKHWSVWRLNLELETEVSGKSRISPRWGANPPGGAPTYDFAKFSQKLHEIERVWIPSLDPPMEVAYFSEPHHDNVTRRNDILIFRLLL